MNVLQAQDIIDLYIQCESLGLASGALAILARAEPDTGGETHRALTVGERDIHILAVRAGTFGDAIDIVSTCPACAAEVEATVTAQALGLERHAHPPTVRQQACSIGGHQLMLRAVTAGDLAELEVHRAPERLRDELLARCVVAVDGVAGAPVPPACSDEAERLLQTIDSAADIELDLVCPDCQSQWSELFDAVSLLRDAIMTAAPRLLTDVADLARLYHWSEKDILAMPAWRRRFYLEAAGL